MITSEELAAIETEGAQAAAAGKGWRANPFLQLRRMPGATGEPVAEWALKHDTWQRGHEKWHRQQDVH
jgi:hypothetical protein